MKEKLEAQTPEKKQEEHNRSLRGLVLGGLALLVIPIIAWLQVQHFGTDSFIFISLFNFNLAILLLILFVVIRNGIKLLLERRNKVLGSHLRTRLVVAFMVLTLIPCSLMFLISTKFVQISVDFWFQERVENSIDSALEIGQTAFIKVGERLQNVAKQIETNAPSQIESNMNFNQENIDLSQHEDQQAIELIKYLNKQLDLFQLSFIAALTPNQTIVFWSGPQQFQKVVKKALESTSSGALKDRGFHSVLAQQGDFDFSVGVLALNDGNILILGENMGIGVKGKLEQIAHGAEEYKRLKKHKLPLKWMLYISLGVLSMSIVLGAMWVAFKIARSLTAPVRLLVEGTERISQGDLSVRIEENFNDELGQLVKSFNKMGNDLELNQNQLKAQAIELAGHNLYIEKVLDNIGSGVISLNTEGKIATANKVALAIINLPLEEITDRYIEEFLPPEEARETSAMRELLSRKEGSWRKQATLHIGGQKRRLLLSAVSLVGPDGEHNGIVTVFDDIAELERMQRVEAWREVAKRVAHEIKNPLTPIKLSAERLHRKFGEQIKDPAFAQCTNVIVRQVENIQSMVQEFSAFAKMPEVSPTDNDIIPIIEDVVALFKNSHHKISFTQDYPAEQLVLSIDADAMQRAFINIIKNAVDALDDISDPAITIKCELSQPKGFLRIDFTDNGCGLAPEAEARLFEPYFSHKKGGTGLGLTIVRSIINDHRGYVNVQHQETQGLTIRVELPLS